MTGIDLSEPPLAAYCLHLLEAAARVDCRKMPVGRLADAKCPAASRCGDLPATLEHVPNLSSVITVCARPVAGERVFLSTLNRKPEVPLFAVPAAEYVLVQGSRAPNDYAKFIKPGTGALGSFG